VTDPGFDTDSPVAHPSEWSAAFILPAGLSRGSGALEADPPDPDFGECCGPAASDIREPEGGG
jgi:hypothetical protein